MTDVTNQAIGREIVIFVKTDISREDKVKRMVDTTLDRFGKINVLVNDAKIDHIQGYSRD